jgi:general secretion pathway protein I
MGVWKVRLSTVNKRAGFTLIEVLIALAILSISLTAIIKATSQNIKDTAYLQEKTIALWVGLSELNETRAGYLHLPLQPDTLTREVEMLGEKWSTEAYMTNSSNSHIQEIHVDVYPKNKTTKLASLMSYFYAAS